MQRRPSDTRAPSFWTVQMAGWLLYMFVNVLSSIPYRHQKQYLAFRGALYLTAFLSSFVMYGVCHWLWHRHTSMLRAAVICVAASYPMGVLNAAASFWSEIHLGGSRAPFSWSTVFVAAPGGSFIMIAWCAFYFGIKHHFALEERTRQLVASELLAAEAQ